MIKLFYIFIASLLFITEIAQGQEGGKINLTIDKAIEIAQKQSPEIVAARHSFRASYWNYCYFKANYLPSLTFTSTPNFNHSINVRNMSNGTSQFIQQNEIITDGVLTIGQNIALTGGTLSLKSSIQRLDILGNNRNHSYLTNPFIISYQQSLFGYNKLKWDKKIEPLRYEEAKKEYVEMIELVSSQVVRKYFDLVRAQTNLRIASTNYSNADTLYKFAKGRYNIGTITENDLLQLEVNCLTEESNMLNARIEVDDYTQELRSYLGITEDVKIEVLIQDNTRNFIVDIEKALYEALKNSPEIIKMERKKQESESNVANKKATTGLKADIYAQLGLTHTGENLRAAYRDPLNQQYVEVGIRLPILDWGRGKGQIQVAKSNRDMIYTQIKQDKVNFELNVIRIVNQFNLQNSRINVALKTDFTANRRNEVARKLYILGKSSILDL